MKHDKIGVIVWRMNPPHKWHIQLIRKSLEQQQKTYIFIGLSFVLDNKNLYSYREIKYLLWVIFQKEIGKTLFISYIYDTSSDRKWTESLYAKIMNDGISKNCTFYWWDIENDYALSCIRQNISIFTKIKVDYTILDRYQEKVYLGDKSFLLNSTLLRKAISEDNRQLVDIMVDKKIRNILLSMYAFWMRVEKNVDITDLSNYKTKAQTRYFFEMKTKDDMLSFIDICKYAKNINMPILFIWGGTNMLFAFDVYEWIIIKNSLSWWKYDRQTKILESYSNESIRKISESLENDYGQAIWHRFIGLPGSIWGAVFGNAWCFWLEIENNFMSAQVINLESGQVSTLSKKDMQFCYRTSIIKEKTSKYFIVKVRFDLSTTIQKYHSDVDNIAYREERQPKWNTCGSFFKNPSQKQTAWYLIEQVWLKWHKVWWAYFSNIHANFLMNEKGTYRDLLYLVTEARKKVKEKYDIDLVNEVRIIENNN